MLLELRKRYYQEALAREEQQILLDQLQSRVGTVERIKRKL